MSKIISVFVAIIAIAMITVLYTPIIPDFEVHRCPFCYGRDFCPNQQVSLRMSSFKDIINNLISVKNVYTTTNGLVLKKLGHTKDLNTMDFLICVFHRSHVMEPCEFQDVDLHRTNYTQALHYNMKTNHYNGFRVCGRNVDDSIDILIRRILKPDGGKDVMNVINLWVISIINGEPLFYKAFDAQHFSLPIYYGACGRLIAVEDCGQNLNEYEDYNWLSRARIARSIIDLALKFTSGDDDFRIYLTDVSPDNIVVNKTTLIAKFVDFGNILIVRKSNVSSVHHSDHYPNAVEHIYSEENVCQSSISDHNIYSICRFIISSSAPWPMMKGGLLHSIPIKISEENPQLEQLITNCVQPNEEMDSGDRFAAIFKLDNALKDILGMHPIDTSNLQLG